MIKDLKKKISLCMACIIAVTTAVFPGEVNTVKVKAKDTLADYVINQETLTNRGELEVASNATASSVTSEAGVTTDEAVKKIKVGDKVKKGKVTYKVTSKSKVEFNKYSDKKAKKVSIPKTVKLQGKKYKVTSVGKKACKGLKKLKTLKIGKNVTKIGAESFSGCKALTKVEIPSKVSEIGKKAFYNCKKINYMNFKTKKLTKKKVGKKAFKGVYRYIVVKVPSKKRFTYEDIFVSKGMGYFLEIRI